MRLPPIVRRHRRLATTGASIDRPYQIFDRNAKLLQKDRAALKASGDRSRQVDYVRDEVADRMLERFQDIKREFRSILDLGSGSGNFTKLLPAKQGIDVKLLDISLAALNRDPSSDFDVKISRQQGDEERLLDSVKNNSLDAVVSCLSLHWVNDLPGTLVQIRESLKPDGVFIGAMLGGDTLFELRTSLQLAEVDQEGGVSPRVSPMTGKASLFSDAGIKTDSPKKDTRDVSNLLSRAGFTLLTVDIDEIKVMYPSIWELFDDLRDMGENNAIIDRRTFIHRDTILGAAAIYEALHGVENGVPATFQVIFMIGWKPGPNQPPLLPRGSASKSLLDIL